MADSKVSLRLLIDKSSQKVLFAEAGKEFVDFLFSILALPVGSVIRLLTKEGVVGSLGNLYDSVENLSETYMQPNQNKDSLLKPKAPALTQIPLSLTNDAQAHTQSYNPYSGPSCYGSTANHGFTLGPSPLGPSSTGANHSSIFPSLFGSSSAANHGSTFGPSSTGANHSSIFPSSAANHGSTFGPSSGANASSSHEGGFVKGVVTYTVTDDLVVKPVSPISSITLLKKFNVTDLDALEEKVVDFTRAEGLKLLKASLQSKAVLTSVFLGNTGA